VLIRHLWQLKTVVFLHWCLIHIVPLRPFHPNFPWLPTNRIVSIRVASPKVAESRTILVAITGVFFKHANVKTARKRSFIRLTPNAALDALIDGLAEGELGDEPADEGVSGSVGVDNLASKTNSYFPPLCDSGIVFTTLS
jgi:hypothetical protein